MPNWCNNSVEIYHDDPKMIERVRTAFQGVSGNGITIVDLMVLEEEVTELGEESFDA